MRYIKALRGVFAAAAATATLLASETAARADEREQCATAADQAQQLRDDGKYRRAREQMLLCARDSCPAPIKRDCLDWLTQLESVAPTVVLAAKDGGKDVSDVKVSLDGVLLTEKLDGRPVPMDLGKHVLKFEYDGHTKEESVIIGAGQKNRTVVVTFDGAPSDAAAGGTAAPPPSKAEAGGSLVPALVVGGVGVLALGSFTIFGLSGTSDVSDMKSTCKPNCEQSRVDSAKSKLLIADISLGIGLVAIGVATYLVLTRPKLDVDVKTGQAPARRAGPSNVSFDFAPVSGGAMGSVGARF